MRRYDEPVEVRRGVIADGVPEPDQLLWRGRLWRVRRVLAHWVETGPWWETTGARAVLGTDESGAAATSVLDRTDLLAEREVWRVEAARPGPAPSGVTGVFELTHDGADGTWRLTRCAD